MHDWVQEVGKYKVQKKGIVYSCTCPSWKFQYAPISKRTCKHLIGILGKEHEEQRVPESLRGETRKMPLNRETKPSMCGPMAYSKWTPKSPIMSSWLWSTKLNGAFVRWEDNKLWTKSGRRLDCPDLVTRSLPPDTVLDAELYAGKSQEDRQLVRLAISGDWTDEVVANVRVCVFDIVHLKKPFARRYRHLVGLQAKHGFFLVQQRVLGQDSDISKMLQDCLENGDEGIVLRAPDGVYECARTKRSTSVVKAKPVETSTGVVDKVVPKPTGVTVVVHEDNRGKNAFGIFVFSKYQPSFKPGDRVSFTFSGRHDNETPENARIIL